jgi:NAD(P)-dependent dehydrogenase (short-subunit alcohol dehydrogenase family)
VVTGANSGIGWHTALELARAGAEVILAARTEAKGRDAVERIRREISQAKVRAEVLDLASLRSVRAFTAKVSYEAKLDLLVNNAGVMSVPKRQLTFRAAVRDELPGAVCFDGAADAGDAAFSFAESDYGVERSGQYGDEEDQLRRSAVGEVVRPLEGVLPVELADLLFTLELGRRCAAAGIGLLSNAAHPGYARTNLQTSGPGGPLNPIEKIVPI